jgi:c-di-GMP-binding flagellar brake protein YcgR
MEVLKLAFERRKYTRYLVQADTYAAFGSHFTKVGKTKDLSIGGLAFEYINNSEEQDQQPFKVAIFLTNDKFFLWNLPCRLVYDFSKNCFNGNQKYGSFYVHKRCGLQFDDIQENQKQSLEYFLIHHTRGLAQTLNDMNDHQ